MNAIFFSGLLLTLGLCCRAEDGTSNMEDWNQFKDEIKKDLCQPEKTSDKTMTDLIACKSVLSDKYEKMKAMAEKMYEKCGTPNEADINGYTKVDLKNKEYKQILMTHCSENMSTCVKTTIDEWKAKHPQKDSKTPRKSGLTDEEKQKLKECVAKAVKGE